MATITYKCPNCDGGLQFEPDSQQYKCEYCLSEFTQADLDQMTAASASDQKSDAGAPDGSGQAEGEAGGHRAEAEAGGHRAEADAGEALVYTCPSCGAEVVTDETTAATFCYYCHNPVVLSGKFKGGYHPDYAIPFAVGRENAVKAFSAWIAKKKYVPRDFYSKDQIEKLSGIYFPYWLYSCEVDGQLVAEATKLRTWIAGNIQYTETQKFDVSREGTMNVKHVTRNALKKANRQLVEGVLPFDMDKLQPFSMGYLSGFSAENRDMNSQEFIQTVEAEVSEYAKNSLMSSAGAGYSNVQIIRNDASILKPEWNYALMPVWTMTYNDKAKNKIYYFAMNGQTGKICGELPVDYKRLTILFLSIFVPILLLLLIGGYLI